MDLFNMLIFHPIRFDTNLFYSNFSTEAISALIVTGEKQEILILGIGNDILSDDGIGPRIVEAMKRDLEWENLNYMTAASGGLDVLELISGYKTVIIIDAIKTRDGIPGDIYYLTPSSFKETLHISSFHDVSFLTALQLGEQLDMPVPNTIHILAIEIVEDLNFSTEFSPPIAEKYDSIYKKVKAAVKKLIT